MDNLSDTKFFPNTKDFRTQNLSRPKIFHDPKFWRTNNFPGPNFFPDPNTKHQTPNSKPQTLSPCGVLPNQWLPICVWVWVKGQAWADKAGAQTDFFYVPRHSDKFQIYRCAGNWILVWFGQQNYPHKTHFERRTAQKLARTNFRVVPNCARGCGVCIIRVTASRAKRACWPMASLLASLAIWIFFLFQTIQLKLHI